MLSALPQPAVVLDPAGTILAANTAMTRLIGRSLDSLTGRSLTAGLGFVHGLAGSENVVRECATTGEESSLAAELPSTSSDSPIRLRVRLRAFDEGGARRVLAILEPLPDQDRLQGELLSLETRLAEGRRIEHELNNILMGLLGHTELLIGYGDLTDRSRRKAELIQKQALRLRDGVAELRKLYAAPPIDAP